MSQSHGQREEQVRAPNRTAGPVGIVSTFFGEIEGCAAVVLSGLLIGSAATARHTRSSSTYKVIFCFIARESVR